MTRSYRVAIGSVLAGPDVGGHVGDLVAALLAFDDASAEPSEGGLERELDVVRLEAPCAGLVHRCPERCEVGLGEVVGGEGALVEDLLEAVADAGVDDLVHLGPHVGLLAVADGLEQQVAQRGLAEGLAEDVEDLAAVGLALSSSFSSSRVNTSPSRVFEATRFHRRQTSVWPMRWMRPKRCSMRFGFHGRS